MTGGGVSYAGCVVAESCNFAGCNGKCGNCRPVVTEEVGPGAFIIKDSGQIRTFETGATRDTNERKPDYRAFLSMRAIRRFGEYMNRHREQPDGTIRAADNWKLGIPVDSYLESLARHSVDFLAAIEDGRHDEAQELACALWFNVQGYLHETTRGK
jgi:hypothetical protein